MVIRLFQLSITLLLISGCKSPSEELLEAQYAAAKSDIKVLHLSGQLYYLDHDKCPTVVSDMDYLLKKDGRNNRDYSNDVWGNAHILSSNGNRCIFVSLGADGKEGGSGFDQDLTSASL